jgi:hypothetical protein
MAAAADETLTPLPPLDARIAIVRSDHDSLTATEIGRFAIELARLAGLERSLYSEEQFKTFFVFSFNLLVDAELQLEKIKAKKEQAQNSG